MWSIPLISAAIAGLVALVVARATRSNAREAWVRDERYAAYRDVVLRASDLLGDVWLGEQRDALKDRVKVKEFTDALGPLMIIAPMGIRQESVQIAELARLAHRDEQVEELRDRLNTFLDTLWNDLVPKGLR